MVGIDPQGRVKLRRPIDSKRRLRNLGGGVGIRLRRCSQCELEARQARVLVGGTCAFRRGQSNRRDAENCVKKGSALDMATNSRIRVFENCDTPLGVLPWSADDAIRRHSCRKKCANVNVCGRALGMCMQWWAIAHVPACRLTSRRLRVGRNARGKSPIIGGMGGVGSERATCQSSMFNWRQAVLPSGGASASVERHGRARNRGGRVATKRREI